MADRQYRYVSPEWYPEWVRPSDGARFSDVLTGLALTNKPFFGDQQPLIARVCGNSFVGARPSGQLMARPAPATHQAVSTVPSPSEPSFEERNAELARLAEAREKALSIPYREALKAVAAERPDLAVRPGSTLSPDAQARCDASARLAILAAQREQATGCSPREALHAVAAENPSLKAVCFPEPVSSAPSPQAAASEKLARLAQAREAQGIPYREALRAVCAENPALWAAYAGR